MKEAVLCLSYLPGAWAVPMSPSKRLALLEIASPTSGELASCKDARCRFLCVADSEMVQLDTA